MEMRILLTNEDDDGYGYLVSTSGQTMHVMFWAKDQPVRKVSYLDAQDLYAKSVEYIQSGLTDYSALHRAKFIMSNAFINHYRDEARSRQHSESLPPSIPG
jgi:hypothetical protein